MAAKLSDLSPRERDVLTAVARGLTNREIARELMVSDATVKTHMGNLKTKIGAPSRASAAAFAYESGHVRPSWLERPDNH